MGSASELSSLGRALILGGLVLLGLGLLLSAAKLLPWLGRLPGDILIRRGTFTFYFPLATSILISVLLSLIARFLFRK